jgi:hypothetical protein
VTPLVHFSFVNGHPSTASENKMKSNRKEKHIERFIIVGLIVALVMSVSGISLAGTSPPQTLNTCTKVNKHGVYGATKVVKGASCPGKAGSQYFQQWVLKSSSGGGSGGCATNVPIDLLGFTQDGSGNLWAVIVPSIQYSSACHPTGTMSLAWNGGPICLATLSGVSNATLQDSGRTSATDISGSPVSNASDFWGVNLGVNISTSALEILGCPASATYSGDAHYLSATF